MARIFKQLIYGSLFIVVLTFLVVVVYSTIVYEEPTCFDKIINQGETNVDCDGPCTSCGFDNVSLEVLDVVLMPAGEIRTTILSEIHNPTEIGAVFAYRVNVHGRLEGLLASVEGTSFVAPSGTRYIVIPGVTVNPSHASRADVEVTHVLWDERNELSQPLIEALNVTTTIEGSKITTKGELSNRSGGIIEAARITALITDESGEVLSASATEIKNIGISTHAPFTIFFPPLEELSLDRQQVNTTVLLESVPSL